MLEAATTIAVLIPTVRCNMESPFLNTMPRPSIPTCTATPSLCTLRRFAFAIDAWSNRQRRLLVGVVVAERLFFTDKITVKSVHNQVVRFSFATKCHAKNRLGPFGAAD